MRELEREHIPTAADPPAAPAESIAIVGAGRAGGSIAAAAREAAHDVLVLGRGDGEVEPGRLVVLCVPDSEIESACAAIISSLPPATPVGHVSGASGLGVLHAAMDAGHPVFSMHPLQTIPSADTSLAGAPCAIAASGPRTLARIRSLADRLGMRPFEVPEEGRAAYHAAASIASNFLVALEESATEALAAAGVENPREVLAPLVLRTAANWADSGAAALTGPIARGDEETVRRHLEALSERTPGLLSLYEELAARTREIAEGRR